MEATSQSIPNGAVPILTAWHMPEVCHGFAGRQGGASVGPFASLNLSYMVGDNRSAVDENWRRMREVIGRDTAVARCLQVHGKVVHEVTVRSATDNLRGDGLVTRDPNQVLTVYSADCVPVLMVDRENRVVGALHAGWRGIVADIAASAVSATRKLGADLHYLRAALGPSIGPCCFEVDNDLAKRFRREIPGAEQHWRAGTKGKAFLDLRAILADQLTMAGMHREEISLVGPCTRCANDRYFSRRAVAGGISGLQASFIGLRK